MEGETVNNKPYKIKDVTRKIRKSLVANTLDELKSKSAEKFGRADEVPNIHLDCDGTEIDEEDYFQTLDLNTELVVVFSGEKWLDPTGFMTISTTKVDNLDDSADCNIEMNRIHLKHLVGQLRHNICNISVLTEPDLEMLSNMDPNSLADITGKEFVDQLKDVTGRILHEKRETRNAIELLRFIAKVQKSEEL